VNDATREIAEPVPGRAELGLPEEGFIFCCFNNNYKITAEVFALWMRLLKRVASSVLWLLEDNPEARRNLSAAANAHGVDARRLCFAPRLPHERHLARQRRADLFLDTLPCNAHTTASDALWAGLPVLTCSASTFAGRVAASLLAAVGLPELAVPTLDEYEALALRLARERAVLAAYRERLARNRLDHALFDSDRFRRALESAYATMWEMHLRGLPPRAFAVAPQD
jgi:predicted O-linked N-acetylglucosamine transferase (SPINDLY family)